MKELVAKYFNDTFHVLEASKDIARDEFKNHQHVRLKAYSIGPQKQRSVEQLNLLMACCQLVADNMDNERFNTKEKVKFACKVHCHFVDENVVAVSPTGGIQFKYRSFSFSELKHMEACNIFEKCFEYMADLLGISKDKLISEAKARMR